MQWEIGRETNPLASPEPFDVVEGSNPTAALEAWKEAQGGALTGTYGAREPGTERWHLHELGADGRFHPFDR